MRVFMVTCLAYYTWHLSQKLSNFVFTPFGRTLLLMIELGSHLMVILIAMYTNTREFRWCSTLLFIIAIAITLSNRSYSANLFKQSKITNWLGELSMSIYLIHIPIKFAFLIICKSNLDKLYSLFIPFAVTVFVASIMFMYGVKAFLSLLIKYRPLARKLMLQEK